MQSEDRPIHFSTELVFEKQEIEKAQLQEFYYNLKVEIMSGYLNFPTSKSEVVNIKLCYSVKKSYLIFLNLNL